MITCSGCPQVSDESWTNPCLGNAGQAQESILKHIIIHFLIMKGAVHVCIE